MREATAGTIIGRGLEAFRDGLQQWKEGGTLAWRQYTGGAIIQLGRAAVCEERKGACTTSAATGVGEKTVFQLYSLSRSSLVVCPLFLFV